jgi:hypothetical protein
MTTAPAETVPAAAAAPAPAPPAPVAALTPEERKAQGFRLRIKVAAISGLSVLLLVGVGLLAHNVPPLLALCGLAMLAAELVGFIASILAIRSSTTTRRLWGGWMCLWLSVGPWFVLSAYGVAYLLVSSLFMPS